MNVAALLALSLALQPGTPTASSAVAYQKEVKKESSVLDQLPIYVGPKKRIAVQDLEIKVTAAGQGGAQINTQVVQTQSPDGTQQGTQQTISVQPVNPPTDLGTGLKEMLVTALSKTNRFVLLERSDLGVQDMQKEQTQAGVNEQSRAAANNMLGAEILVRGAVTEFAYSGSGSGAAGLLSGLGFGQSSTTSTVTIDVRLYDASTGEIYDSEKATGSVKSKETKIQLDLSNLHFNNDQFTNSSLGQAARLAIEKAVYYICRQMDGRPWEGRVADVVDDEGEGKQIYLNVGQRSGIKVGDEFEVFTAGHVIMDPDNPGRVLAKSKGKRIGRCKVTSVDVNISIAAPIEGDGFEAKDVIRLPGSVRTIIPPAAATPAPAQEPAPAPAPAQEPAPAPAPTTGSGQQ